MNLSQLLTTLVVVASSATGLVFADELGFDPMEPKTSSHSHDDPCAAEDGDDSDDEGDAGNSTSTNSTQGNETTTGSGSSSSGSASNTTSSGNSTTTGNQTGGSSSSTTTTGNSTADDEDAQGADGSDESDSDAAKGEADCGEGPAGNETSDDGNETAEPEEDTAEPESAPATPPAPDCADVHIEDSGDDLLGEDQDWSWLVAANARHLSVRFEGSSGLGLGGSPDVTLVDGAGRVVASGDSGDGWGGLSVEQFGPMTPGLWRLSYESEGLLSGYWVTIDLSC
jgi:hypothetical protein